MDDLYSGNADSQNSVMAKLKAALGAAYDNPVTQNPAYQNFAQSNGDNPAASLMLAPMALFGAMAGGGRGSAPATPATPAGPSAADQYAQAARDRYANLQAQYGDNPALAKWLTQVGSHVPQAPTPAPATPPPAQTPTPPANNPRPFSPEWFQQTNQRNYDNLLAHQDSPLAKAFLGAFNQQAQMLPTQLRQPMQGGPAGLINTPPAAPRPQGGPMQGAPAGLIQPPQAAPDMQGLHDRLTQIFGQINGGKPSVGL